MGGFLPIYATILLFFVPFVTSSATQNESSDGELANIADPVTDNFSKSFEFSFDFLKPKETENSTSFVQPVTDDQNDQINGLDHNEKFTSLDQNETDIFQSFTQSGKDLFEYSSSSNYNDSLRGVDQFGEVYHNQDQTENEMFYKVYVRKCCAVGEAFVHSQNSCAKSNTSFVVPSFITSRNQSVNLTEDQMIIHEGILTSCEPITLEQEEFLLFESGDLFATKLEEFFRPGHYCLESMVDDYKEPPFVRITAAYCPNSGVMPTFDPNKIPVRKCCPQGEISTFKNSECSDRKNITTVEWTVPIQPTYDISSFSTNFTDIYEIVAGFPECVMDDRGETMEAVWNFHLLEENGYLNVPSLGLATHSYCIDEFLADEQNRSSFAYVCLSPTDHRKFTQFKFNPSCQPGNEFCVQKCCHAGQILNENSECINDPLFHLVPQSVPIYYPNGTILHLQNIDYKFGNPLCGSRDNFLTKEQERAEILLDGSLRHISYEPLECDPKIAKVIPSADYCYDKILFGKTDALDDIGPKIIPGAIICYHDNFLQNLDQKKQVNFIYSIFLGISDVFILISIIIYMTVPDQTKRGLNKNIKLGHSILGRILLSFLFSLFSAYLFLIITKTSSESISLSSKAACTTLGVAVYISFLATFFWLNVLCFELWWKCARQERTSGRRWLWYQLYGWGNPVLLGTIVLFIEFSPSIGSCFVKPNFGFNSCFFSDTKTFGSAAKWVYLNGPVSILLITDLIFFLLTVNTLMQTVQQSHKSTVKRQTRQRLKLCFKLFLVMGIGWLTEIICVAVTFETWYLTEVFNCLQGFVIFLIFILKPKIMVAVKEMICLACCNKQPTQQPLRGRLTFNSSVLSDFLSSTKRSRAPHHNLSFSTASSSLSWASSINDSPTSSLPRNQNFPVSGDTKDDVC